MHIKKKISNNLGLKCCTPDAQFVKKRPIYTIMKALGYLTLPQNGGSDPLTRDIIFDGPKVKSIHVFA